MSLVTQETPEEIKARGAFYTPSELTAFLARWAVRGQADRVLEPSCGDGAFLVALADRFAELGASRTGMRITAVERESTEAEKARLIAPDADVRVLDFFDLDPADIRQVDAVVGNPPYIRYHGFAGSDRAKGKARALAQGVALTNLASSWAHFVVHASSFLNSSGRLALVLPAELLHTDYGAPVRQFLVDRFSSVVVVAFDRMVFADAQVDALLLLASRDDALGLRILRVRDETSLVNVDPTLPSALSANLARWSGAVDTDAGGVYGEVLRDTPTLRLAEVASVDIGYVSGANDYFVLLPAHARELGLPESVLIPTVRRPSDIPGLNTRDEEIALLFRPDDAALGNRAVRMYLELGEKAGVAKRYKPRSRRAWYVVPLPTKPAHAFMPYMAHHGPRLVVNRHGARSSNLLHGVSLRPAAPSPEALSVSMASSLTLLSAEVEGRAYGGGVLKLETREAERLVLPRLDATIERRLLTAHPEADEHIRAGRLKDAAMLADNILGLDHRKLWRAYATFRDRRFMRAYSRRRR